MSGFVLKVIALLTMIVDHTGAALFPQFPILRMIGRIAFPIYIFLIAEGCRHTRSMERYMLRLLIFALISEIPFDIALYIPAQLFRLSPTIADWGHQNVFFTLALGVAAVWGCKKLKSIGVPVPVAVLAVVPCMILAELCHTDYGMLGVGAIFLCAMCPGKWWSLGAVALFIVLQYFGGWMYVALACVALVAIALYNGKRGPRAGLPFYAAYPMHLAIIAVLKMTVF